MIRDALSEPDYDRIAKVVGQLCHEHAYAVHQPHARNGGLIGLAAAAIALGTVRGECGSIAFPCSLSYQRLANVRLGRTVLHAI